MLANENNQALSGPAAQCFVEATSTGQRLPFSGDDSFLFTLAGVSYWRLDCTDIAALICALVTLCLEGTAVTSRSTGKLSTIEIEVIREMRAMRASPGDGLNASLLESAARAAHHFILDSHGNVQLRLATIAREFGAEMRTLERAFFDGYRMTMVECQVEARLAYSKRLLSIFPPTKISAVAALLGYNVVRDFNRFFKKHMRQSPREWSRKERARIASEKSRSSLD